MFGPLYQTTDQWSINLCDLRNPYSEQWTSGDLTNSCTFTFEQSITQTVGKV